MDDTDLTIMDVSISEKRSRLSGQTARESERWFVSSRLCPMFVSHMKTLQCTLITDILLRSDSGMPHGSLSSNLNLVR
jgi:hypothetical protein